MSNISRERIIETAANLSNKAGLENLSLKMIAEELKIKSPSLYNHVSSLDDIKKLCDELIEAHGEMLPKFN